MYVGTSALLFKTGSVMINFPNPNAGPLQETVILTALSTDGSNLIVQVKVGVECRGIGFSRLLLTITSEALGTVYMFSMHFFIKTLLIILTFGVKWIESWITSKIMSVDSYYTPVVAHIRELKGAESNSAFS